MQTPEITTITMSVIVAMLIVRDLPLGIIIPILIMVVLTMLATN